MTPPRKRPPLDVFAPPGRASVYGTELALLGGALPPEEAGWSLDTWEDELSDAFHDYPAEGDR